MNAKITLQRGFMLLAVVLLLLGITACSGSEPVSGKADEKTYTLTLNVAYPPPKYDDSPKYIAVEKFKKLVEERTNGRVNIDVYYSNQLIKQGQALDALAQGVIDMESSAAYWGDLVPELNFLWLPFGFYGSEHALHVMRETEAGDLFEESLKEYGVKPLFYHPTGIEGIISKTPITTVEDMKGQKLRLGTGIWTEWYKSVGAAPANIAGAEQYQALMRNTVDGTMYVFYAMDTYKLNEVAKHVTVPGVVDPILAVNMISLKKWNQLPPDIQEIITAVSKEVEKEAVGALEKMTNRALETAKENGVTVHNLTEQAYNSFKESAEVVWEMFEAENERTKRMVDILREDRQKYIKNNPDADNWQERWIK